MSNPSPEFHGLLISTDSTAINVTKYPILAGIILEKWGAYDAFIADVNKAGEERRAKEMAVSEALQTVFAHLPADFDMNATPPTTGPQRPTEALFGAIDQSHP